MNGENYYDAQDSVSFSTHDGAEDDTVTIGAPAPSTGYTDPSRVAITANTPKLNSFNSTHAVATFDIVFDVTIANDAGGFDSYQIVKRIGVDKCRIAEEARTNETVSVVESKSAYKSITESQVYKMRKLAGLV